MRVLAWLKIIDFGERAQVARFRRARRRGGVKAARGPGKQVQVA